MPGQLIFIHIPKTAGSSFLSTLVKPNVPDDEFYQVPGGVLDLLKPVERTAARRASFVYGHVPYGIHLYTHQPAQYITFLRHPLDRAVSWYYWIKDLQRIDLFRRHPLRNYADSVSIKEFYENRTHSNEQTRYLSGVLSKKLYSFLPSQRLDNWCLEKAKYHLRDFACFGLVEQFETSMSLFQKTFNWEERIQTPRRRKTRKRPSLDEIRDVAPGTIAKLREHHQLDMELYRFAQDLFSDRVRSAGLTLKSDEN
jgi:hypothetical protein